MAFVNEVRLNGRVVRDAERKGNGPWRFTIVQRGGQRKDSQERYPDDFFSVACWDVAAADIKKGAEVTVTGRLRPTSWEKDGVKHTSFEIVARELE